MIDLLREQQTEITPILPMIPILPITLHRSMRPQARRTALRFRPSSVPHGFDVRWDGSVHMTRYTAFRCPEDLLEKAKAKARQDRRSLSNYIITLIEKDVGREAPAERKATRRAGKPAAGSGRSGIALEK